MEKPWPTSQTVNSSRLSRKRLSDRSSGGSAEKQVQQGRAKKIERRADQKRRCEAPGLLQLAAHGRSQRKPDAVRHRVKPGDSTSERFRDTFLNKRRVHRIAHAAEREQRPVRENRNPEGR